MIKNSISIKHYYKDRHGWGFGIFKNVAQISVFVERFFPRGSSCKMLTAPEEMAATP